MESERERDKRVQPAHACSHLLMHEHEEKCDGSVSCAGYILIDKKIKSPRLALVSSCARARKQDKFFES